MQALGYMINEATTTPKEMRIVSDKNNRLSIETVMQDLNIKNRNGRWYGTDDFQGQLSCERTMELINSKNFFGEAGHPMTTELVRQQSIDLNNIAHCMTKLWLEGDTIKAHTHGTPNKQGELFNNLILEGTIPSFSLRALGTVQNTSRGAEVKNIRLITYDWVVFPSHKKAYMQKILGEYGKVNESIEELDRDIEGNKLILDESASTIVPITNKEVIDYVKTESTNLNSVVDSLEFLYENVQVIDGGTKVMLSDNLGTSFVINLENYITNELMNYCYKL